MKILFVQPNSLNSVVSKAMHIYNFESLGLYYLAATLKKDHTLDFFDFNNEEIIAGRTTNDCFTIYLNKFQPEIVAFSALTSVRTGKIKELCTLVKGIDKNIKTLVGGPHAFLMKSDFEDSAIDLVITHDSMTFFHKAIEFIEQGLSIEKIRTIFIGNEYRNCNLLLDDWPLPYRKLGEKYKDYYQISIGHVGQSRIKENISSIKTSSGCPFRCNFCCLWKIYPNYEKRRVDKIIEEISEIDNQYIFFADDESMIDEKYMMKLAKSIISSGINKYYVMYARADTVARNEFLVKKWAEAGLKQIWIGIEGATNSQLDRYNKKNKVISQEDAIKIARMYGVDVHATVLVDFTFTKEDFEYILLYTKQILKLTSCHFFILTPFRGSNYYCDFMSKYPNKFLTHNPDHYSIRQSVIEPSNMSIEDFHYSYAELQKKFNSDTIPFSYDGKFNNKECEVEFKNLKEKNERLYEEIIKSHYHY